MGRRMAARFDCVAARVIRAGGPLPAEPAALHAESHATHHEVGAEHDGNRTAVELKIPERDPLADLPLPGVLLPSVNDSIAQEKNRQ